MRYCQRYNKVSEPVDLMTGQIEPVSVEYFKNYARANGFVFDDAGIAVQDSLAVILPAGQTAVIVPALINTSIITLTREGNAFIQAESVGNGQFSFDTTTGLISFAIAGNPGGEALAISYGVPAEEGTTVQFTSDDELISDLITGARESLERWTGLAIVPHQWKVQVWNGLGNVELPFSNGSVDIDTFTDSDGETVSEYEVYNGPFVSLVSPYYSGMELTYTVTPVCPARLKTAICVEALFRYENRGDVDEQGDLSKKAMTMSASFKRVSTWLA